MDSENNKTEQTRVAFNSFCPLILHDQSSDLKMNSLEKVSDDSFEFMEKLCDQTMAKVLDESFDDDEDLLEGIEIPKFNDTLEEVEFILEMGEKLKANKENKLNCCKASEANDMSSICMFERCEGSQPPMKRFKLSSTSGAIMLASTPNGVETTASSRLSFASCRLMISNQSYHSPSTPVHQEKF